MKKKFINGLLLVALFVGFTGSMVSCKDYDDEKLTEEINARKDLEKSLRQALADQKTALEQEIQNLQTTINNCKQEFEDFKTLINNKFAEYVTLVQYNKFLDEYAAFKDNLGNIYYTKTEINDMISNYFTKTEINNLLNGYYTKEEIDNLFTLKLGDYYTKTWIDENIYTKSEIDNLFISKLSEYYKKSELYNRDEIDALLNKYYNQDEINALFGNYYDKEKIDAFFGNYYDKDKIDELLAAIDSNFLNYYTSDVIDGKLNDLKEELKGLVTGEAITNTIINILQSGDMTLVNTLDQYFITNEELTNYITTGEGATTIQNIINNSLILVNDSIDKVASIAKEALELAKQNEQNLSDLEGRLTIAEGNITVLQTNVTNILETLIPDLTARVEDLEDITSDLEDRVFNLEGRMGDVEQKANDAYALAEANSALISELTIAQLLMADEIDVLGDDIKALREKVYQDSLTADALHREMLETISGLVSAIEENGDLISNVNTTLYEFILNFNESVVPELDEKFVEINNNLTVFFQKITNLNVWMKNLFAKFITSIELNGTINPLFGELSLPTDVRSNILVAFYGSVDDMGFEFPTMRPAYFAQQPEEDKVEELAEDFDMLGNYKAVEGYVSPTETANKTLITRDGAEGNAGTLFMTVNPADRDFTGTKFSLINSLDQRNSAVKLSPLVKSNHLLTFGVTRAGNGFYESKVTIKDVTNSRLQLNLDEEGIVEVFKDANNYKEGINLTLLANTIYNNINKVLEADAVKAEWTDDSLGQMGIVSQYGIAAAAMRPLSFAFAKDIYNIDDELFKHIEEFINNSISKIQFDFPELDIDDYRIVSYEIVGQKEDGTYKINVTVEKNGGQQTFVIEMNVNTGNPDAVMADAINLVDNVNDYINELNNISIVNSLHSVTSEIMSALIRSVNNHWHLANWADQPNKILQPVLFLLDNKGYRRLSKIRKYTPNVEAGNLVLVPSSYTCEVLAPAYKKFVAVVNASKGGVSAKGGDAECLAEMERINSQPGMKTVFFGGFNEDCQIPFPATAGYDYEIIYQAVDYSGKVASNRYYVSVR
jgi:TolA-binding protein